MIDPALWKRLDDEYKNEKKKYKDALPSRNFILRIISERQRPQRMREFISAFGLSERQERALAQRINAMLRDGQLQRLSYGNIGLPQQDIIETGRVIAHADGFGFFVPDGGGADGFLPPPAMLRLGLMHDDRIRARLDYLKEDGRKEYFPLEVLQRAHSELVGTLVCERDGNYLLSEGKFLNLNIALPDKLPAGVRAGAVLRVRIKRYARYDDPAEGEILEVLGSADGGHIRNTTAAINHNLPRIFPAAALAEADALADELQPADYLGRRDMRAHPFVTIDGADARDFDDAVCAERSGDNLRLHVAIADVAHYVPRGSALDAEAYNRATSVYFPNQVIPMLPEKLSNGLCSLNPQVDRLALVCTMTINPEGKIIRSAFSRAVIHSHQRFTYEAVEDFLFNGQPAPALAPAVLKSLETLHEVYTRLLAVRAERGALDFDFPEAQFQYDERGQIVAIGTKSRLQAHKLIEECMVAANICSAKYLEKHRLPGLFRVHEPPLPAQLLALEAIARMVKVKLEVPLTPKCVARLLAALAPLPDHSAWEYKVLFTMNQALYGVENRGHFGLALSHYCHFTSPIRRYPDLVVHRALQAALAGERLVYGEGELAAIAQHCSENERRAEEVSREVVKALKCDYLGASGRELFPGKISRVMPFGLFVMLDDLFIDGLVHIRSLPEPFHFDEAKETLGNASGSQIYRVGQPVWVRVLNIDSVSGRIDMQLTPAPAEGAPAQKPKKKAADEGSASVPAKKTKKGSASPETEATPAPVKKAKKKATAETAVETVEAEGSASTPAKAKAAKKKAADEGSASTKGSASVKTADVPAPAKKAKKGNASAEVVEAEGSASVKAEEAPAPAKKAKKGSASTEAEAAPAPVKKAKKKASAEAVEAKGSASVKSDDVPAPAKKAKKGSASIETASPEESASTPTKKAKKATAEMASPEGSAATKKKATEKEAVAALSKGSASVKVEETSAPAKKAKKGSASVETSSSEGSASSPAKAKVAKKKATAEGSASVEAEVAPAPAKKAKKKAATEAVEAKGSASLQTKGNKKGSASVKSDDVPAPAKKAKKGSASVETAIPEGSASAPAKKAKKKATAEVVEVKGSASVKSDDVPVPAKKAKKGSASVETDSSEKSASAPAKEKAAKKKATAEGSASAKTDDSSAQAKKAKKGSASVEAEVAPAPAKKAKKKAATEAVETEGSASVETASSGGSASTKAEEAPAPTKKAKKKAVVETAETVETVPAAEFQPRAPGLTRFTPTDADLPLPLLNAEQRQRARAKRRTGARRSQPLPLPRLAGVAPVPGLEGTKPEPMKSKKSRRRRRGRNRK